MAKQRGIRAVAPQRPKGSEGIKWQNGFGSAGAEGSLYGGTFNGVPVPTSPQSASQASYGPPTPDAQFTTDVGSIGRNEDIFAATSGVNWQRNADNAITGYNVDWGNVDVTNPFSRAALLVKSYKQAQQGASNSYAARGLRNSGAYGRAQDANTFGFGQGQNNFDLGVRQAIGDYGTQRSNAALGLVDRASSNPPPTPTGQTPSTQVFDATAFNAANMGAKQGNGKRVKLANGWAIEYVDGKPTRFIPPGGK